MNHLSEEERNFGTLSGQTGAFPLTDLSLRVSVRGLDYALTLSQTFANPNDDSIEAVYTFPLPARAAVTGFTLTTASRKVEGELKERGQARADYRAAIQNGHQAAMVEEERPEIFTMTVGNLPAGEQVKVELVLVGPLSCLDNTAFFRFPLVVAPKYIPCQNLARPPVADASRLSPPVLLPGYPYPVRLGIEVELDTPLPFESTLALHPQDGKYRYLGKGRIDHDFLLSFPFDPERQITSLQMHHDTFCLTLIPPAAALSKIPKQVVILLDRSGSMEGWKMKAAARTSARLLESLNDHDSFCVLAFDTGVEEIRPESRARTDGLVPASDRNRMLYAREVLRVGTRGGTEVAPGLRLALSKLALEKCKSERHIVLITDGHIGNDLEIHGLLALKGRGIRVSTIGIDYSVNAGFLQKLARNHRGLCQLVHSEPQLDHFMTCICQAIGNPSLRDIKVSEATDLVYQHADLYPGIPTRIYGRLKHKGPLRFTATDCNGEQHSQEVTRRAGGPLVEKLWAREFVQKMEYRYEIGAPNAPRSEQITRFSLKHGVLSRFTAFLAVDDSRVVPLQTCTQVQPVPLPTGWAPTACASGIRVDLLPTEKRGFRLHPLAGILLLPFALLCSLLFYLAQLALVWWRGPERPSVTGKFRPLRHQLLTALDQGASNYVVKETLNDLLDQLGDDHRQARARGEKLRHSWIFRRRRIKFWAEQLGT